MANEEPSLASLVTQVVDDGRAMAAAEIELVKAKISERINAYKAAVVVLVIGGVLALAGLIALLVGAILSLATLIGPGFATAIVVVVTFFFAGVFALIGIARLSPPKIPRSS